jgi:hypothetical protein
MQLSPLRQSFDSIKRLLTGSSPIANREMFVAIGTTPTSAPEIPQQNRFLDSKKT